MTNFKYVTFEGAIWFPGVDETSLKPDESLRFFGTCKAISITSGKNFYLDSYLYFNAKKVRFTNQVTFSMLAE